VRKELDMKSYAGELYRRGQLSAKWVSEQVDENGFLPCGGDLGCYYKCVYPLRSAGYTHKASLLLSRILALHLTETGDLRNSDSEKTKGSYTSWFSQVYPNGWVILGAWLLGRFDAVKLLMDGVILNFYDPEMGTFRSCAKPREDIYDVNSAAMAVELFMLFDLEKAEKAARFLTDHIAGQPDIQNRYYGKIKKPFIYLTGDDARNDTYSFIKKGEKDQAFWFLGMPCAALTQLFELTGKLEYLDTARHYFDVFLECGDPAFCGAGSGKAFWSSSMLYRITGEKIYRDSCIRLMDFFFSIQREDGTFLLPGMDPSGLTPKFLFDTTPEYARWFLEVAAELSAI
jgi:hypothetical protein